MEKTPLFEILRKAASKYSDKEAVVTGTASFTYVKIYNEVCILSDYLKAKGIKKGDCVIVLLPNSIFSIYSIFAVTKLGATFIYLSDEIITPNLEYVINDCNARGIITNSVHIDKHGLNDLGRTTIINIDLLTETTLKDIAVESKVKGTFGNEEIACLIYTSGSTGKPKAVVSTHFNIVFSVNAIQACIQVETDDIIGCYIPFSFDYGLYQIFLSFQVGATLFIGERKHVGSKIIKDIIEKKITGLPIVPSMASTLVALQKREKRTVGGLRFITSTGAKFNSSSIYDLRNSFPNCKLFSMYGLTECKRVSILPYQDLIRKIDSIGKPLPDTECFIVDPEGRILPTNQVGELVVKGPHVMMGYWNNDMQTKKFFKIWNGERVLFTGDFCSIDEEGYLYFHGRRDDIFKHNGYRLSTIEIETSALEIKGVSQVAYITPTEDTPSYLFVVSEINEEQIRYELSKKLERYKIRRVD